MTDESEAVAWMKDKYGPDEEDWCFGIVREECSKCAEPCSDDLHKSGVHFRDLCCARIGKFEWFADAGISNHMVSERHKVARDGHREKLEMAERLKKKLADRDDRDSGGRGGDSATSGPPCC